MNILGATSVDQEQLRIPFDDLANSPAEWRTIFTQSLNSIFTSLGSHDPIELLSKTSTQSQITYASKKKQIESGDVLAAINQGGVEQPQVEILHLTASL